MQLRHLRYFVALAEEMSFTRAAERLHVSPSPLSRRIQDLEAEIGFPLFARDAARLSLTAAGRVFLTEVLDTLGRVDHAVDAARLAGQGRLGRLRVGYMPAALYAPAVLEIFGRFQAAHPFVVVSYTLMPHTQQFEALASGRIDLGVVYQDSGPDVAADRRLLASERLEFIFRRGHPLARQKRLRLADLASEPFIMPTRAHNLSLSERLGAVWASKGFRPRVAAESDSFSTTVMLVSSGAGISFAGHGPASQFSAKVDVRAAEDFDFAWGAELIWSSHNFSPVVGTFLEALPA